MLDVTLSPAETSARKYYLHNKYLTSVACRVVIKICVALDVDRRTPIRVDSTCAAPTGA